ncbi:hypothetical protein EXIGLDRAFT_578011, partial [Exidia glandulosa HHB12029]
GRHARRKLEAFWAQVRYLIIDEISMVSCEFLQKLASIVGEAKGGSFPPVGGRPLYWPSDASLKEEEKIGRQLYEQFETVVILKQQMRTDDPVWRGFLGRLRHGACNRQDEELLQTMNMRSAQYDTTDLGEEWNEAILVTPRHAVRRRWNQAALRKHCQSSGRQLYKCRSWDTIGGRALTLRERFMLAEQNARKHYRSVQKTLEDVIELAVGMKVMITLNMQTDIDLANGARGEIVDIVLHPDEPNI